MNLASFPGPAQLSVACSTSLVPRLSVATKSLGTRLPVLQYVLQATETWAGPGNEASVGPELRLRRCAAVCRYYLYDDQIVGGNVGVRADYNRRQRVGRLHVKNIRSAAPGERQRR